MGGGLPDCNGGETREEGSYCSTPQMGELHGGFYMRWPQYVQRS